MARFAGDRPEVHPEGLAAALERQLAPIGGAVRIRRQRDSGLSWWGRVSETPWIVGSGWIGVDGNGGSLNFRENHAQTFDNE